MRNFEAFQVIFASQIIIALGSTDILDRERDVGKSWKVEGDYDYFRSTSELQLPGNLQFLPNKFNFSKVGDSRGIWAIFAKDKNGCDLFDDDSFQWDLNEDGRKTKKDSKKDCDRSASASFIFKPSSQSVESVKVKYMFGGANATIRIISGKERELLMEKKSGGSSTDGWTESSTEVHRNTVTLEAVIGGRGDYILIDVITAHVPEYVNTPSPGRSNDNSNQSDDNKNHPRTTQPPIRTTTDDSNPTTAESTKHPHPAPVSSQQGLKDLLPVVSLVFFGVMTLIFL